MEIGFSYMKAVFGLMILDFLTETIDYEDININVGVLELDNAVLALFWEGERPKLGSLAVTLPNGTSSQILGERNIMLGNMIGSQLSKKFGKIVLVSINLSRGTALNAGIILLELVGKIKKGED